jgi:Spy/CpxP family protein refolding chaperone
MDPPATCRHYRPIFFAAAPRCVGTWDDAIIALKSTFDTVMRLLPFLLLLTMTTAARAQEHNHASPYAGMQERDIKALSDGDIDGLLSGSGMGYAMAAELNGYPGPKHVLELADELALTDEQRQQTEVLFAAMQSEAVALGRQLIALETDLDAAFASGQVTADDIRDLTARIGAVEGMLRAVHLNTHLKMTPLLSMHQRHMYQELRGYGEGGMDHGSMDHSGMDHDGMNHDH